MDYKFVDNEKDLTQSVVEFFDKPEFWKAAIGNTPRYFLHIRIGNKHHFGLSKFCAFDNITVEEYISKYRYQTDGSITQTHIAKLTKQHWVPRSEIEDEIRTAFDQWIIKFHPNYTLDNASFISIFKPENLSPAKKRFIDPKTLEEKLKLQREIGEVGELIAYEHELNRLRISGVKNAEKYIEHIAKINAAAGFDLSCLINGDNRFIEVKSSLNCNQDFFITENEYQTLKQLGENGFIYLVQILDLAKKEGQVLYIIRNPIEYLKVNGNLKPVAYKAKLRKKNAP